MQPTKIKTLGETECIYIEGGNEVISIEFEVPLGHSGRKTHLAEAGRSTK